MNRQTAAGDKILPFVARFYLPSGTAQVSNRRERGPIVSSTHHLYLPPRFGGYILKHKINMVREDMRRFWWIHLIVLMNEIVGNSLEFDALELLGLPFWQRRRVWKRTPPSSLAHVHDMWPHRITFIGCRRRRWPRVLGNLTLWIIYWIHLNFCGQISRRHCFTEVAFCKQHNRHSSVQQCPVHPSTTADL